MWACGHQWEMRLLAQSLGERSGKGKESSPSWWRTEKQGAATVGSMEQKSQHYYMLEFPKTATGEERARDVTIS